VILGTVVFTTSAPTFLTRLFGVVLVGAVVWRRIEPRPRAHFAKPWFVALGGAFGLLSGVSVAVSGVLFLVRG